MDTSISNNYHGTPQLSGHLAVVDDDDAVRVALSRLLTVSKIKCRAYDSGRAFLKPEAMPSCLLLDVDMPDMTGIEVQEHLIALGIRIPTVVLTGGRDGMIEKRAKTLGAAAVLHKPTTCEVLMRAIYSADKN